MAYSFQGEQTQDGAILAKGKELSYGTYACLSAGMTDYLLVKNTDDTYTVTAPSGFKFDFDSAGRLVKQTDEKGKTTSLSYSDGKATITGDMDIVHPFIPFRTTVIKTDFLNFMK